MFWKKDKIAEEDLLNHELDTSTDEKDSHSSAMDNIFWEEFWGNLDFWEDVQEIERKVNKDIYYYLNLIWNILWNINILFFLIIAIASSYFYIQNSWSGQFYRAWFLDWVCSYILPEEAQEPWQSCSWVKTLLDNIKMQADDLVEKQFKSIYWNLPKIYSLENFIFTKEVQFLLEKTQNKLKVTDIVQDFDNLLQWFYSIDKMQIQCDGLEITKDLLVITTCTVFSADWNNEIMWTDGTYINKTWWSTISLASSFFNYIDKTSSNFSLVNKQKKFTREEFVWNWYYTYSTTFNLELKYQNSWSFNF